MKKLERLKESIDKNIFIDYYRYHNNSDTAEYFNITSGDVTQLAKFFNFVKSPAEIAETKKQTNIKRYGVDNPSKNPEIIKKIQVNRNNDSAVEKLSQRYNSRFEELLKTLPSKEILYKEYIAEDTNYEDLLTKYNLTGWTLDKVLKHYNIQKSKKQSNKKSIQTKISIYGKDNSNNWKKGQVTRIDHYGSLAESYRQGVINYQKTFLDRYGVKSVYQLDSINRHKRDSKPNLKFKKLLEDNNINYIQEFPLDTKSYDFKVENTLIEINPTITHNSTYGFLKNEPLDNDYHYLKTKLARDAGYRCFNIWDWDDTDSIIRLLLPQPVLYARKCYIKCILKEEAKTFINKFHLQRYAKDEIRIGLFCGDELVSVMTFGKPRYNKNYQYELIRYCSSCKVVGGAEKLFTFFKNNFQPQSIISYCDWSKFNGDVYPKLGFSYFNYTIGCHWYNEKLNIHITDNLLRQRGFDQLLGKTFGFYGKGTSNEDLMLKHGFVKIFDSGQAVFTYRSN